jgi:hypothetical protein
MKKGADSPVSTVPAMIAELAMVSWQTICYRSLLMVTGTCSAAEYQRMSLEKASAAWDATIAFMTGEGEAAIVAPFLIRARANARRLSKIDTSYTR